MAGRRTPSELPERYAELSPLHRVHPGCPPTLLVHGEHDQTAPVAAMRRLEQVGVPVTGVPTPDRPRLRPGGHRLVTAGPHGHPRPGALPGHPGRHRPTSRSPVRTPRAHPMSQQQADGEPEGRPSIEAGIALKGTCDEDPIGHTTEARAVGRQPGGRAAPRSCRRTFRPCHRNTRASVFIGVSALE